jgi:hypothetical protein
MAQAKQEKAEKFVYVFGDANRAPVDFAAQPKGTRCVLVTPNGNEYALTAGVSLLTSEMTPEIQAKIERSKTWDSKDVRFPNLRIPREG